MMGSMKFPSYPRVRNTVLIELGVLTTWVIAAIPIVCGRQPELPTVTAAGVPENEFSRVQRVLAKTGIRSERGRGGRGGIALLVSANRQDEARTILIED